MITAWISLTQGTNGITCEKVNHNGKFFLFVRVLLFVGNRISALDIIKYVIVIAAQKWDGKVNQSDVEKTRLAEKEILGSNTGSFSTVFPLISDILDPLCAISQPIQLDYQRAKGF